MRVRYRDRLIREGAIAAVGLALSVALFLVAPLALAGPLPLFVSYSLGFFIGLLVPASCGLLIKERSRKGGEIVLAILAPLAAAYLAGSPAVAAVAAGLLAGATATALSFFQNRFDTLADAVRLAAKLLLVALGISVLLLASWDRALLTAGGIAILVALGLLAGWSVRGAGAPEIVVLGPAGSGKTLLFLALYSLFVREFSGRRQEVILGPGAEAMRVEDLLSDLEGGRLPKPTGENDLAFYLLSGKKYGFVPIETGIVDYAGRYTAAINPAHHAAAVARVAAAIGVDEESVRAHIGSFGYLKRLKEDQAGAIGGVMDAVVAACLYHRMEMAGKILFLIDGDQIVNFHARGREELTHLFGYYSRLMDLFGGDRVYGFVVTKTDRITNIKDIEDTSEEAARIEREIYESLLRVSTFHEIHNRALSVPVFFFAASVDAMLEPGEGRDALRQIYPWRVGEVVRFGF
ncbi:MAG: hypothetical protein PHP59_00815 [Methanofollis sp.]|uniref:hypothetical protein n=1 Tax=Methanofollis sp. TaxID=2052835 RepID=UPI002638AED5|nr:hypothetical protein [Methanofollis sp.]MDD4253902.1 hypothetical protein [Methanofollis sp.]